MQSYQILQTKLHIPPMRANLVARPRLIERLNAGLDRKLSLISAPAGFGKTTLISEWTSDLRFARDGLPVGVTGTEAIEHRRIEAEGTRHTANRVGWLSLDEGDNDPVRFLAYLIAALRTVEAGIGKGALGALQSPGFADANSPRLPEIVLTPLINEITAIPDRVFLVLDDYHLIEAEPVHDALRFLLEHLPSQMHVVIATREDPHLPLARLRARGQLAELRASDLRFSSAEATEFLNRAMGLDLSAEDLAVLEGRTEGWIAGLQLAAISMQGRREVTGFIQSFTGSHRFVMDYLVEEVLEQQPESVQTFLLQTAILDRLCGPLCDAVRLGSDQSPGTSEGTAAGHGDGQATLEMLDRANLFIVPLDDERRWYRFHHLFADLLRQRLRQTQPEIMPLLHLRASKWYEQHDQPSNAIRHAMAAQDFGRAADLAELAWPAWSVGFKAITWFGWLKDLPDEVVRARPVLSTAIAWALLSAGRLEEAKARLVDAERCLEATTGQSRRMVVVDQAQFGALPAWLATVHAYHAQAIGDVDATARYVRRALDLYPDDDYYNRAAVSGFLGLAYWASGDLRAAQETFAENLFQNAHDQIKGTFVVTDIKMALGHLREAVGACEYALRLADELGQPLGTEDVYTAIGGLHRERGDLETAAQDLATARRLGEQVELPDWRHRWCIAQAQLLESLGDLDRALDLLHEAERVYVRTPVPDVRPIAARKARVWVRQGRLAEALDWARRRGLSGSDELGYLGEFEHMVLARMLIAHYRRARADEFIDEVMGLLDRLLQAAEAGSRMGSVIEILALQALANEARGNLSAALPYLERALVLAEPEGYVRIFVDDGPPMARLLYQAAARGILPEYTRRLLAAFLVKTEAPAPPKSQVVESELVEPLSERELEVLELVAQGLANREIAARLFLSLNTVKAHTRNIYGKLGVHNRTQAVARARVLGTLPSVQ